MITSH